MIFATLIIILQNQMIFFQFIFEILLMVPERFYKWLHNGLDFGNADRKHYNLLSLLSGEVDYMIQ